MIDDTVILKTIITWVKVLNRFVTIAVIHILNEQPTFMDAITMLWLRLSFLFPARWQLQVFFLVFPQKKYFFASH
jgi:hypothetical protein